MGDFFPRSGRGEAELDATYQRRSWRVIKPLRNSADRLTGLPRVLGERLETIKAPGLKYAQVGQIRERLVQRRRADEVRAKVLMQAGECVPGDLMSGTRVLASILADRSRTR